MAGSGGTSRLEAEGGSGYERLILGTVLSYGRPALDEIFTCAVELPGFRGTTGESRHADLWDAIWTLQDTGAPFDQVAVGEEMSRRKRLDVLALAHLVEGATTPADLAYYVQSWMDYRTKDDTALALALIGQRAKNGATVDDLRTALAQAQTGLDRYRMPDEWDDGPPKLIDMATVVRTQVDWFWEPRIPYGFLTAMEGDPGEGKSFVGCALATAAGLGRGLPEMDGTREPVRTLLLTAEDDLGATVRGRLEDMGADLSAGMIQAADRGFSLDTDGLGRLETMISASGARLVIIDPIVAYMPPTTNTNQANEVRAVLKNLARIARKHRAAIVIVRHLSKAQAAKHIYRGQGSIDFTAACRSVMLVGRDGEEQDSARAVIHIKCNLAAMGNPVGYVIDQGRFMWTGASDVRAGDVLGGDRVNGSNGAAVKEAREFLLEMLADGPVDSVDIEKMGKGAGISRATLWRAKKEMGVGANRISQEGDRRGSGRWEWWLPK